MVLMKDCNNCLGDSKENTKGLSVSFDRERVIRRLNIVVGQVKGLVKMLEEDKYCIDIITQSSAAKQGLTNVEDIILENHIATCLIDQIKKGNEDKAIEEIIKVYKLKRK